MKKKKKTYANKTSNVSSNKEDLSFCNKQNEKTEHRILKYININDSAVKKIFYNINFPLLFFLIKKPTAYGKILHKFIIAPLK